MTGFVLVRTDGAYVAMSGHSGSYTSALQHARIYATREMAARDRCVGNETVQEVGAQFAGRRRW